MENNALSSVDDQTLENTYDLHPSSGDIIKITMKAVEHIKRIHSDEKPDTSWGLRLGVSGGGCSGLSYKILFSAPKEKDYIFDFDQVKVFLDPKSAIYLKGIVVDYKDGLSGKGFVFENPNAKNHCGCGESFSV